MEALSKGLATAGRDVRGVVATSGTIATPIMVVREAALDWNIRRMADFCRERNVFLAPHAKTTMSPEIVRRQLAAGAWAVTVANVFQAIALGLAAGPRIVIANEVVDPASVAWLDRRLGDPALTTFCYIDSLAGAQRLAGGITRGALPVLLELGFDGGRAGIRGRGAALDLARAVQGLPGLRLVGVAGFEGFLATSRDPAGVERVRAFLQDLHGLAGDLLAEGLVSTGDDLILSAGGSAFFDLVAEELSRPLPHPSVRVVLRSGCYVTHDHGAYVGVTPFQGETAFRPAIELLSTVLSRPEPDLAICDMGRRDAPFDAGLPTPLYVRAGTGGATRPATGLEVQRLNDQHAYVSVAGGELQVGDVVAFGISHPCTAFDKWRVIPLVDEELRIRELIHTCF